MMPPRAWLLLLERPRATSWLLLASLVAALVLALVPWGLLGRRASAAPRCSAAHPPAAERRAARDGAPGGEGLAAGPKEQQRIVDAYRAELMKGAERQVAEARKKEEAAPREKAGIGTLSRPHVFPTATRGAMPT